MIVLDANILIRAVLGRRVLGLLSQYGTSISFLAPDVALDEAREHLPEILSARGMLLPAALESLERVAGIVEFVAAEIYVPFEADARARIDRRDVDDWPILAVALAMNCPIWTEDNDFFGCGVATWTTDRVELYLAGRATHTS